MNGILKLGLVGVITACGSAALSQSKASSPAEQINAWCNAMVESKGTTSFDNVMSVSSLVLEQKTMMSALEAQQSLAMERYGPPDSCETIDVKKVGTRHETHRILLFHEKYASTWEFSFYKTSSAWQAVKFWFRDTVLEKQEDPQ